MATERSARRIVREMRQALGLSRRELARLAQVDHTYLGRYENGETVNEPSERWLRDVMTALGVNLGEIRKEAS